MVKTFDHDVITRTGQLKLRGLTQVNGSIEERFGSINSPTNFIANCLRNSN